MFMVLEIRDKVVYKHIVHVTCVCYLCVDIFLKKKIPKCVLKINLTFLQRKRVVFYGFRDSGHNCLQTYSTCHMLVLPVC